MAVTVLVCTRFFFSSRRRHTRCSRDWSSDVCSSDLAMVTMLTAESAAAFDELTRTGKDKLLTSQKDYDWPNTFRTARFIPAVEYIQEIGRASCRERV